ncbi:AAA family ATPase [bacterium]|nr:AAA family ATPase [bacterium]
MTFYSDLQVLSRDAVERAVALALSEGPAFLDRVGGQGTRNWVLRRQGTELDPRAVLGVAWSEEHGGARVPREGLLQLGGPRLTRLLGAHGYEVVRRMEAARALLSTNTPMTETSDVPDLPTRASLIAEAVREWRDRCLLGGGSLFTDRSLWTEEGFDALDRYFVQNLDYGEGTFFTKLKGQLDPAGPEVKQLAAEMFWVMYVIVSLSQMGAETKRSQIRQVWAWSSEELDVDHPLLGGSLDWGLASTGTAYNTHRWREFVFFVLLMKSWFRLEGARQQELLESPWDFAAWMDEQPKVKGRQLRHVLAYLLFPQMFEPMVTGSHKRAVVEAFAGEAGVSVPASKSDRLSYDRALHAIRGHLTGEMAVEGFSFYEKPVAGMWRKSSQVFQTDDRPSLPTGEDGVHWLEERFGNAAYWVVSAGPGGRLMPAFMRDGILATAAAGLGDLEEFESREAIHTELAQLVGGNPWNNSLRFWQFSHEMSPGDVVIAKQGRNRLLGYGRVAGPYSFDEDNESFPHKVAVDWADVQPRSIGGIGHGYPSKALTRAEPAPNVAMLLRWLDGEDLEVQSSSESVSAETRLKGPSVMEEVMREIFMDPSRFTGLVDSLARRKNLILQGPPGVGKTFLARRLAKALAGTSATSSVEMIQFHQSYSYEDFVQGWRPTESGGFELRNGVFYEFCSRAAEAPDVPHVFMIDEINRGNMSRIFGEVLMLIEADKRGEEHAVPLTYSADRERFSVPVNVHVLGMMNTADRSLSMVDYALRRRFAFASLAPAFDSAAFSEYLHEAGVDIGVVPHIVERMQHLNEVIRSDTASLGPGFEIGHSYFVPFEDDEDLGTDWYREIIQSQIQPLLEEYWFDAPAKAEEHVERLLR